MYLIIIFITLLNFILGLFGKILGSKRLKQIIIYNLSFAWLLTLFCFYEVCISGHVCIIVLGKWINSGLLEINWGFLFDNLSTSMLVLVLSISLIVHLYSLEYMKTDPHKERFLCYLSLFTFFMSCLVSANNFIGMFLGWEGVGLASYLLINFWYKRIEANRASIKAMLVNRVGDFSLALGIFAIFYVFKSIDYNIVFSLSYKFENMKMIFLGFDIDILSLIALLLFIGIMAKSAQLGLHTWLADAMEGPTPVSALIHAATMVTAGVFLLIRCSPIFEYAPSILILVVIMGGITAFVSALIATFQQDIKKIIAFSTCSQLGFMIAACGFSQYALGFAHLINHAFFKALLFLTAGLLIHTFNDEQDTNRFGNVVVFFSLSYIFMIIGSVSLVGLPFLTGFYSKHFILEVAYIKYDAYNVLVCILLLLATFFTSIYSTKLIIKCFILPNNSYKQYFKNWHESPIMIITLTILSFLSIYGGYLLSDLFLSFANSIWGNAVFNREANNYVIEIEYLSSYVVFLPLILSILGILIVIIYYSKKNNVLKFRLNYKTLTLSYFFFDGCHFNKIYNQLIVKPTVWFSYVVYKDIDKGVLSVWGPTHIQFLTNKISKTITTMQTGLLYHYICWMVLGSVLILFFNHLWYFVILFLIYCITIIWIYLFVVFFNFLYRKLKKTTNKYI